MFTLWTNLYGAQTTIATNVADLWGKPTNQKEPEGPQTPARFFYEKS